MKMFVVKNLWWIVFILALLLLGIHSLKIASLNVDSTSILLLAIMLVSPFIAAVKKNKFGDFEAEIDIAEIRKIKSEVKKTLTETQENNEELHEIYATSDAIRSLAEQDPIIALAKIRIELEKVLGRLARFNSIKIASSAESVGRWR